MSEFTKSKENESIKPQNHITSRELLKFSPVIHYFLNKTVQNIVCEAISSIHDAIVKLVKTFTKIILVLNNKVLYFTIARCPFMKVNLVQIFRGSSYFSLVDSKTGSSDTLFDFFFNFFKFQTNLVQFFVHFLEALSHLYEYSRITSRDIRKS